MIVLKSQLELDVMRKGGRILASTMDVLIDKIRPGITTRELDETAEDNLRAHNAIPAFKGYRGYPCCICASINSEVVHGIPSEKKLIEGDIISIDIGARHEGYYTDTAVTVGVGKISAEKQRLIDITREVLNVGVEKMNTSNRLSDICAGIQHAVEKEGFSVVRDFVGHGIGAELHEDPQIPNFGIPGQGPRIQEGMVFAIEPMVNAGAGDVCVGDDGWTVKTADGKPSAHFEHTVALTEKGTEILTWQKIRL